jgi:hypothetical protein
MRITGRMMMVAGSDLDIMDLVVRPARSIVGKLITVPIGFPRP